MPDYTIKTMIFSTKPALAFEEHGCLHGFKGTSHRRLTRDIGVSLTDERLTSLASELGLDMPEMPDWLDDVNDVHIWCDGEGRLALTELVHRGQPFALEVELAGAALAHHRREEIAQHIETITALEDAGGTLDDLESLCGALNELEEIRLEIKDELDACGWEAERSLPDSIDEMVSDAGLELDTCGGLPQWRDGQVAEEWAATADGHHLLYPPDGAISGSSDENLSSGTIGWCISDWSR